jgi:hypothetical protein
MSNNEQMPIPDFLDIDEATVGAAQAVVTGKGGLLNPPGTARKSKNEKSGEVYERWTEGAIIEGTWRDVTKTGLIQVTVQLKVRAGFPNQHERTWSRYCVSPQILAKQPPTKPTHVSMHERSIGALSLLIKSAGFMPKTGGLTGKLMNHMFPVGKGNSSAPICGKDVMVNFVNSDNEGGKTDRQTQAESFLPYAPVVPVATETK